MSWIERTTKKRIKELDEHPELNSHDFEEKGNKMTKDIKFYVIVILLAAFVKHFGINGIIRKLIYFHFIFQY